MRAVIQRVLNASIFCAVHKELIGTIGPGLFVLVGISQDDSTEEVEYMARKIVNIRLYDGKPTRSVKDMGYEILCQSQITLHSKLKGNKVSFHKAMSPDLSAPLFSTLIQSLSHLYSPCKIKVGKFGGRKEVHIINDGPFTLILDSPPRTNSTS